MEEGHGLLGQNCPVKHSHIYHLSVIIWYCESKIDFLICLSFLMAPLFGIKVEWSVLNKVKK